MLTSPIVLLVGPVAIPRHRCGPPGGGWAVTRALDADEQRRFLRTVERAPSARDRAIATLFLYTGLRLSELAALDVDDVAVSARRGRLTVRSGKGDLGREVPLNSACRSVLDTWTKAR
ncbi:MAG: tyrosine-type recombinase/integrase, partial [Frankiaceae bacterium]